MASSARGHDPETSLMRSVVTRGHCRAQPARGRIGGDVKTRPYLIPGNAADQPAGPAPNLKVSFCIPTKNRRRTIEACLASIRAQTFEHVEIVVVDNGSSDGTAEVARKYADVVDTCDGHLGAVRQRSIDLSTGDILGLIDDDIILPHTEWLDRAVRVFADHPTASTVWPVQVPPTGANWTTRCFFELNDAIFAARVRRDTAIFGGGNSLFLRAAVERAGGFDPAVGFGEDFDLASKLKALGYTVVWHPDPLVHDSMWSLKEIYRKQRWGARAVAAHGPGLLAQTYRDTIYEQVIVAGRTMFRALLFEGKPWWLTYPAVFAAKALPYSEAIVCRSVIGSKARVSRKDGT